MTDETNQARELLDLLLDFILSMPAPMEAKSQIETVLNELTSVSREKGQVLEVTLFL